MRTLNSNAVDFQSETAHLCEVAQDVLKAYLNLYEKEAETAKALFPMTVYRTHGPRKKIALVIQLEVTGEDDNGAY